MNATANATAEQLVAEPAYARLKDIVIASTGLAYYHEQNADFARRLLRRVLAVGAPDTDAYLALLLDPVRGAFELEALTAEIAIGETFFFRHAELFAALIHQTIPGLIARNAARRQLRIWCAGCADGPEPYSVSILLKRHFGSQLVGWDVTILGTDINAFSLVAAHEGCYNDWSLRSIPSHIRRECFVREDKHWRLLSEYRQNVFFEVHNLIGPALPGEPFDLILCRNVMIYFDQMHTGRVIQRLHDALVPEGWLVVGASEPNMTSFTSFRTVNAPGVTLYQKASTGTPSPPPLWLPPQKLDGTPLNETREATAGVEGTVEPSGALSPEIDNLNQLVHLQHALELKRKGIAIESGRSVRRSLYLEGQSAMAHYRLGLLQRARGDETRARRSFHNLLRLLAPLPSDELVSGADKLTVGQLERLAVTQMEGLSLV